MPRSIQFRPSPQPTIGVEVELQVVNVASGGLVSGTPGILQAASEPDGEFLKAELFQNCLEVVTPVCQDLDEVRRVLAERLQVAQELAAEQGYAVFGAGTHPFSIALRQEMTDSERYRKLLEDLQWTARQFNVFGLHVHVGVDSGEKVVALLNQSVLYLPQLLALSSSSPFWEGEDTGLSSVRSKIFEGLSIAGIPYAFNSWDDYSRLVNHLIDTRSIHTFREIWWDVRPHPDFGTLEWRICDCPSTLDELMALVALMYTLVVKLADDFDGGLVHRRPHASIIKENKWRATRYGIHGEVIDPFTYRSVPMCESIEMVLDELSTHSDRLGTSSYLAEIPRILRSGTSADRQRTVHAQTGDFGVVVQSLRTEFFRHLEGSGEVSR